MKYNSDIEQNVGEVMLLLAGHSARSSGQEEAQIVRSDAGMDLGKRVVEAGLRHCVRWHSSLNWRPRRDFFGATPRLTVVVIFTCSCRSSWHIWCRWWLNCLRCASFRWCFWGVRKKSVKLYTCRESRPSLQARFCLERVCRCRSPELQRPP